MDVVVAHLLKVVGGEGGTVAAAAVEDEGRVFVGVEVFDVAFDDAAREMSCAGGVALLPFVVFAYVDEVKALIGLEASEGFFDGDFVDAGFGVFDELEKACGVFHVDCPSGVVVVVRSRGMKRAV